MWMVTMQNSASQNSYQKLIFGVTPFFSPNVLSHFYFYPSILFFCSHLTLFKVTVSRCLSSVFIRGEVRTTKDRSPIHHKDQHRGQLVTHSQSQITLANWLNRHVFELREVTCVSAENTYTWMGRTFWLHSHCRQMWHKSFFFVLIV